MGAHCALAVVRLNRERRKHNCRRKRALVAVCQCRARLAFQREAIQLVPRIRVIDMAARLAEDLGEAAKILRAEVVLCCFLVDRPVAVDVLD